MRGFDRNEIRKALVALTRKEFERFKEQTWSELGALDVDMTADALDCYADLVEALRQETVAKKQLKMASANVFKAFQATIATLSQSAAKFPGSFIFIVIDCRDVQKSVEDMNRGLNVYEFLNLAGCLAGCSAV
ncbi:unnamed protein product [Toxocara canis]|uniref:AAA_8 domain-containing protein n=1 Tax=Toxocara canis TaxID=6265 RepID=A0A183VCU3_TOXCA|nr:unnamed protein product [Toxocara canis]